MTRSMRALLGYVLCGAAFGAVLAGCPQVNQGPTASGTIAPNDGFAPLAVTFTDASRAGASPIRAWLWNFGDGTTSNARNPRHTYAFPGTYTVTLTVLAVQGEVTAEIGKVNVRTTSSFGTLGVDGGTVSPGGVGITVAANALAGEVVFGVNAEADPFETPSTEVIVPASQAFTLFHNAASTNAYALDGAGAIVPAELSFPFNADGIPAADRTPEKVQLLCALPNGATVPMLGEISGGTLTVQVTQIPSRCTFAVVYRPDATLRTITASPIKGAPGGAVWNGQWRVAFSPHLLQELTALRIGEIDAANVYTRRNFTEEELDATADAITAAVGTLAAQYTFAGFRAPVLAAPGDTYELSFYNMNASVGSDFEDFDEVLYRDRTLGGITIDPAALVAIAQHNAQAAAAGDEDAGQEIGAAGAFAQTLFEALFDNYAFPHVTTPSVLLGAAANESRDVFALQGLRDGLSVWLGQMADGLDTARGLQQDDYLLLSQPLLYPFNTQFDGYSAAGQEFFAYIARHLSPPLAYIGSGVPPVPGGVLEAVRAQLDSMDNLDFESALFGAADAIDLSFSVSLHQSLAETYWDFARARAFANTEAAQLRASDTTRHKNELIPGRFEADAVITATLKAPADTRTVSFDTEASLTNIAPLSTRAILIEVNPLATSLTLEFNREDWKEDERGNSLAVAVYKQGAAAVELAADADSIVLQNFNEEPNTCYARVVLIVSNLSLNTRSSFALEATTEALLIGPESRVLDNYVAACDPTYTYSIAGSSLLPGTNLTVDSLNMTSGVWRGTQDVAPSAQEWTHNLLLVEPPALLSDTAFLVISGGSTGDPQGPIEALQLAPFVQSTGTVAAILNAVPNEPQEFLDESIARTEDAIIAYSYDRYMDSFDEGNPDMTWPALLPMTRAAVRAMDTIQDFMASRPGNAGTIRKFVVAGASKRGWTTWLTAAADPRVSAIVPMVIDIVNMRSQINHHYNAYGTFSSALQDYVDADIFCRFGTPESVSLLKIVDPFSYLARFTMPKFIVNSTGDQFFLPDASRFYYSFLDGEKHLYFAPNTDHSLSDDFAFDEAMIASVLAFYIAQVRNSNAVASDDYPRPNVTYTYTNDGCRGRMDIHADQVPLAATLWVANNPSGRDFRLEEIGQAWSPLRLIPDPLDPSHFVGAVRVPATTGCTVGTLPGGVTGWNAFFVALTFPGPDPSQPEVVFTVATDVKVVPDTYPVPGPAVPITVCLGDN